MKRTFYVLLGIAATIYLLSCIHEPQDAPLDLTLESTLDQYSHTGDHTWYRMPESDDYANIPNQDPKNLITKEKVELGKMLFFETGIGLEPKYQVSMGTYSCASCHIPSRGFTAGRFQGIADGAIGFGTTGEGRSKNPAYQGHEVDAQAARPLPMINLAYVTNALWAGNFGSFHVNLGTENVWTTDSLFEINFKGLMGLEANNERALIVHRQVVNKAVTDSLGYTAMFDKAFPDIPVSSRYTRQTAGFAIAAYFRTILANQAPFQKWLRGEKKAMTDRQKRGALVFFGKAGCVNCHNSPSFNSVPHQFFALGVKNYYQTEHAVFRAGPNEDRNFGRGGFTKRPEDMHKYKVPQLYNMKDIGFYFHGASKTSLRDVIEYFDKAIPENPEVPASQIAGAFRPLGLSDQEKGDLLDFLENGLYDPNMDRFAPKVTMSGNCFPNNDNLSKIEMGCQ